MHTNAILRGFVNHKHGPAVFFFFFKMTSAHFKKKQKTLVFIVHYRRVTIFRPTSEPIAPYNKQQIIRATNYVHKN